MRAYFRACKVIACLAAALLPSHLAAEELTLQQAVEIALKNNPAAAAARLSAEAASESARGARALSNPEIIVAPSVVGDAGSDSAVLFSQPLEINGARRVRGRIASYQADAARANAEVVRRDLVLRVSQGYWDIAAAQEVVSLNEENITYLETVRAAVQKQYDVGAVPGAQLLKMDVELARARQDLAQAQLRLAQSKAQMNNLLARPATTDFSVPRSLDPHQAVALDRGALAASALAHRPEIAAAQAQLAAAQNEIGAAALRTLPDVAIQARKESFDSEVKDGGIAVAISLPVLDWGSARAEKRRAQAASRSQERQLESVRDSAALDVEQAMQRVAFASQVVAEYQGGVLERSEELAAMARKGYEKGANNYLELLEAQRTLRSVRSDYYSALAEYAKALAQLEWAAACTIESPANAEVKI